MEVGKHIDTGSRLSGTFDFTAIVRTIAERRFATIMGLKE